MGGTIQPTGPDFEQGIPELADGAWLQGQFQGHAVVAARAGDEVFVVAAACSHWGENLADGAVIGDTIRCGGHHACFSLRTGEALAAPALAPIRTYCVEKRGGKHVVVAAATQPSSIVIVGAGAAGAAAADMLRRQGYTGKLTLVGADPDLPCDRPNVSKDYLAGGAPEEWLFLRDRAGWESAGIELMLGTRVEAIDRAKKTVKLSNGKTLEYGALLLASGGDPVRLPIPGAERAFLVRTVADARAIIAEVPKAKRAAIIGSSFIGLEAAASLRARGLEVHVIGPDRVPLERIVGPAIGEEVRAMHQKNGVIFHLGRKPSAIDASGVTLDDGTKVAAELVVMGVGVRPVTALAEAAGLTMDRGVVVDSQLRTSDPSIFAAGDIARYPDARTGEKLRIEHWVVAQVQGQTAAKAMLGQQVRFDAVPFFWTTMYGVSLRYVGHAEAWDRADLAGDVKKNDCAVAFRKAGRTLAVATLGRDRDALLAADALQRQDEAALAKLVPAK
jgi:NADPH-dependent 2,4-dienoyl-CoA reductase/sulfur reductase-like enzyme/nitrite reductase/ring-hydroxylating ferredoxin subunit